MYIRELTSGLFIEDRDLGGNTNRNDHPYYLLAVQE